MQDSVLAVGVLVYAAAVLDAWRVLPGDDGAKWRLMVIFPGAYLALTLVCALGVPALRRAVRRHLWLSYRTGFGQSVVSVLGGLGLLGAVAALIVWQVHHSAQGGVSPSGAFAGFGAGLGLLTAQAAQVRALESDENVRGAIAADGEDPDDP
jgi:hypothetical protein